MTEDTLVDFAVVVFREEGQWQVGSLPHRAAEDLDGLVARGPPAADRGAQRSRSAPTATTSSWRPARR